MATLSYPTKLTEFPYASYLEITRYQYRKGLKVSQEKNSKDVTAYLQTGILGPITTGLGNLVATAYNTNNPTGFTSQSNNPPGSPAGRAPAANGAVNPNLDPVDYTLKQLEEAAKNKENTTGLPIKSTSETTIINLPLPNEFQSSYGAEWDNSFKLGTLALLFADPNKFIGGALLTGGLAALQDFTGAFIQQKFKDLTDKIPDPAVRAGAKAAGPAFIQGAVNPFEINSALGIKGQGLSNILGIAGLAPNENAIQFFKKMNFRDFDLSFDMFANNATEQKRISEIVRIMKVAMHPTADASGVGGVLGFPDVFVLTPKFVSVTDGGSVKQINHPELPGTKLCALTRMNVNYTPMNNFVTTEDGKIPYMTVKCSFTEITALTQTDFDEGSSNSGFQQGNY